MARDTASGPSSRVTTDAPPRGTTSPTSTWPRRLISLLLIVSGLLTFVYSIASIYFATQAVQLTGRTLGTHTPAEFGLAYQEVHFTSREDHLRLAGWLIPGVLPSGRLTTDRTLVVM